MPQESNGESELTEKEEAAADRLTKTVLDFIHSYAGGEVVQHTPLGHTYVDGLLIDTALTSDLGYETAIRDNQGQWLPVQRYEDRSAAQVGHEWWCHHVVGKTTVTKLGYPDLIADKEVELHRDNWDD